MTEIAPVTYEVWEAFVAERKNWDILEGPVHFLATDRQRYLAGPEFNNPLEVSYTAETFPTREAAAYFIGVQCVNAALAAVGIIHADA